MAATNKRSIDDVKESADTIPVQSNVSKKRKLNQKSSKSTATETTKHSKADDAKSSDTSDFVFKASAFSVGSEVPVPSKHSKESKHSPTKKKKSGKEWSFGDSFGNFKTKKKDKESSTKLTKDDSKTSNDDEKDCTEKESSSSKDSKDSKDSKEDSWGGAWSNPNPDGTYKMNFNWGNWTDSNAKIDLNPGTAIGYGSQAPTFDPDKIESTEETQKVVETMSGKLDTGDAEDEVLCSVHCKVYNLENGKYVERGSGKVNVNRLKDGDDKESKVKTKGRILCRRDAIMTMLINAPILKDMKFEKDGKFLRFGVLEQKDTSANKTAEESDAKDEDSDLISEIKTYLLRPRDSAHTDVMLSKIQEIQEAL